MYPKDLVNIWRWAINALSVPLRAKEKYGGKKVQLWLSGSSLLAKAQPFFLQYAFWQLVDAMSTPHGQIVREVQKNPESLSML